MKRIIVLLANILMVITSFAQSNASDLANKGMEYYKSNDYKNAFICFEKAANMGNAYAQACVGYLYRFGEGTTQNLTEAYNWFSKAAENGEVLAQSQLGDMFKNGIGVSQNYVKAAELYKKASDQGNDYCTNELALLYISGNGVVKDANNAISLLTKTANNGNIFGIRNLAKLYSDGKEVSKDLSKSFLLYKKGAELDDAESMINLALYYINGKGVNVDTLKYVNWMRKAAEKNHPFAQYAMGKIYERGTGMNIDYSTAAAWYSKAQDHIQDAKYSLAVLYSEGKGVAFDMAKATAMLNDLAVNGHDLAKSVLNSLEFGLKKSNVVNENTFAIILSNNQCLNWQTDYSFQYDGVTFKKFCETALGIPEKHIRYVVNPTLSNLMVEFDWLHKVLDAYNGEAKALIYYAGPGASDESTHESFILPADGDATDPASGFSLNELYKTLGSMPSKSVIVFLDACFNGANREGKMIASARGVQIKAKPTVPAGNIVVFNASQNEETAWTNEEGVHGLFTYNVLKAIKDSNGNITLGELSQKVTNSIKKKVIVEKGVSQTPVVLASPEVGENWKNWTLNR